MIPKIEESPAKSDKPILRLRQVGRAFGAVKVLAGLDLDLYQGEVFTLLGPSGCGKTTTLRLVAGLEHPDAGQIWFDDRLIAGPREGVSVPAHRRNMGMVFQSYAIWPHMTVFENVAYPLRARGVAREEIRRRVDEALARVNLSGLEDRPGPALSGGQQQRVAMARALVYEPKLLLLDEPFSNLDAKLREQMRTELRKLLKGLGITVLLVTHDQLEALGMSDRIAVMNGGRIEQIGSALDIYDAPDNRFVRDFLGRMALLKACVADAPEHGPIRVSLSSPTSAHNGSSQFRIDRAASQRMTVGQDVTVAIRPEHIGVVPLEFGGPQDGENLAFGVIETLTFAGDRYEAQIRVGELAFVSCVPKTNAWREGQKVVLTFPPQELSVWPA